ncbi:immunoglobulin-like domain-containing protein [Litchfieldia salsa]|uniref:Bacterial Ig-like domain-containing protein n=1 Tax=Litchfieldia salsa TaxID=930152 RepID=A0A1H0SMH2_9BACI|nr:immunoglobulin-like domain-containing protein [Litchfieldia salsa]SDP42941.1 hypothetical protein SAMN05216565_10318 [Litchfieldia salsa]
MNFFKIFLPVTLFLLLVITACRSLDNKVEERNKEVGYSIFPQKSDNITDSSENTEYAVNNGKWFLEGGGNIGFGISTGIMKPNSEVSVSLMAHPVQQVVLDKDVRFQLTKRDKDNNLIEIIKEEIVFINTLTSDKKYFSTFIPDKGNIHYMLSTEILGEDGQVEDTLVTRIYAPDQIINGELYSDKYQYTSNETLVLKLDNNGSTNLSFGLSYIIERYKQDKWEQIKINVGFETIGLIIEPGQTFEQNIPLNQLKVPGLYRVLKDVTAEGTDLNNTLTVEFELEGN